MKYRREIDGLRGLAVVPVILFHAGFNYFSGGFVGVDVFFVISGYLITSIILAEQEAGKFSLRKFYERRARRILPALFFVMAACLPFAWFLLMSDDMRHFAQSVAAVALFSSNILFFLQSGYFDAASELKPLLHTWSLGVEEQYYLLFPLLIMLGWRLGKRWIVSSLVAIAAVSLAAAQWGSLHSPAAAFFLLPTRGWELLVGSFIAFYFATNREAVHRPHNPYVNDFGSIAGLSLVIYAIFRFDGNTPFPGLYALVPTIGTALIILYATPQTVVGKMLGSKLFVGIGLISYSAYLWHQPLFTFARYASSDELSGAMYLSLSLAALILAYFSWQYVEQPFRNRVAVSKKTLFSFAVIGSLMFIGVGATGHITNGFGNRLSGEKGEYASYFRNSLPEWEYIEREHVLALYRDECSFYNLSQYRIRNATQIPKEGIPLDCHTRNAAFDNAIFLWGDSHVQQLYPGLRKYLPTDWQVLIVASSGCAAALNASPNKRDYCEYSNWFAYNAILKSRPDVVLIAQDGPNSVSKMNEISARLTRAGVKKVIFTGETPHWIRPLSEIIVSLLWENTPKRTFVGINKLALSNDLKLKSSFQNSEDTTFVSLIDYFCNRNGCLTFLGGDKKTGITSWDKAHLTSVASDQLAKDVLVPLIVRGALSPP